MLKLLFKALQSTAPRITPITKYLNILGRYDENTIFTKDQNLTIGFKVSGVSYIAMGAENEEILHTNKFSFLTRMNTGIECIVFIKKEKNTLRKKAGLKNKNLYSQAIIEKWEKDFNLLEMEYYIFVSTRRDDLFDKMDQKIQNDDASDSYSIKKMKLKNFSEEIKNYLNDYSIRSLSANEILSFYATLLNGEKTEIECDKYFFDDYYNNADIAFKKNYFIRELPNKTLYSSFVSVKTYESNTLTRKNLNNLLQIKSDLMICIGFSPLGKKVAERMIISARSKTKEEEIIYRIDDLKSKLEAEKTKLFDISINIMVIEDEKEKLERSIDDLIAMCKRNHLIPVRESIAQRATFFSLFPALWGKCSTRKRTQTASVLSTFLSFENERIGQNFNSWGEEAVAILRNSLGKPYLFNFHLPILEGEKKNSLKAGHTLIIGKTGLGKTTLATFLMNGLFKYGINILAFDKLQGMSVFTNFVDGEYHDVNEKFTLNPFSLSDTPENRKFLEVFLFSLTGIDTQAMNPETAEKQVAIKEALDRIYKYTKAEERQFSVFWTSIEDDELKTMLQPYKNGILDSTQDALNFEKQLSVLNMDNLLKDKQLTSIVALYLFQKLLSVSKEQGRGFFIFVDELREYLGNPTMASQLLGLILEARKINGAVCMGVQNIEFFDEMVEKMKISFLDNIARFIIYPTSNANELESLKKIVGLSHEETEFLKTTPQIERKVLIKQGFNDERGIKASVIADLNLAGLEEYLQVFTSSITDIKRMQELKIQYPAEWRKYFLQ